MVDLIKVQRLSREGVHSKLMAMEAVSTCKSDDIVHSIWKHIAVHKRTGQILRIWSNIKVVFGMSASTFVGYAYSSYGISYTEEEAKTIRDKYFRLYPTITRYHNEVWKNYKKPTYFVYTALGRKVKPNLGTDGINIPVQGSGAETTKLAVHYLVKDYGVEVLNYIYNVVHDSIAMRIPAGKEDEWSVALETSMVKAWKEISKTKLFHFKDIPIIADVEIYKWEDKDGTK